MACDANYDRFLLFWVQISSDFTGGLDTIHDWHTKVSKNNAVPHADFVNLFDLLQRFFAVNAEVSLEVNIDT